MDQAPFVGLFERVFHAIALEIGVDAVFVLPVEHVTVKIRQPGLVAVAADVYGADIAFGRHVIDGIGISFPVFGVQKGAARAANKGLSSNRKVYRSSKVLGVQNPFTKGFWSPKATPRGGEPISCFAAGKCFLIK